MQRWYSRNFILSAAVLALVMAFASASAFAQYNVTVLDSNVTGHGHVDPLLMNGWGLSYGPTTAFWLSDEGSGWSTLYDGSGNPQSLQVIVPGANGGQGSPTGIVYNSSRNFKIDTWASEFMFCTLDGTIQGWSTFSPSASLIAVTNPKAVYTGLAINAANTMIYAADTLNNKVDMYNGTFQLVGSFTDTGLPQGAVPFGIQDIGGQLYVTFVAANGGPSGAVDIFTEAGVFVKRLITGAPLNQPWGVAMAPSNFGALSNTLLVSNNTDTGTINGFNPSTGKLVGTVTGANGKSIKIPQLWGILFGGGTAANGQTNQLFWTAGPENGLEGGFGYISPK
ncbi:MAG TPA: TIGR03118 family protein [Terriglobales bacterium]|jgi:uncharacterized protein (TIGR03118 family)|nr:TIGR03118 family protein [Terriglobales bacterium]